MSSFSTLHPAGLEKYIAGIVAIKPTAGVIINWTSKPLLDRNAAIQSLPFNAYSPSPLIPLINIIRPGAINRPRPLASVQSRSKFYY